MTGNKDAKGTDKNKDSNAEFIEFIEKMGADFKSVK